MTDTPEHIRKIQRDIILKKTMKERFSLGVEAINFGRMLVISNIRKSNPEISEIDLKLAVFKRYYENSYSKKELDSIIQSFKKYSKRK